MGITVICCSLFPHSSNLCAIFSLYKFEAGWDAEVVLDRKKRAGLYMVVRPTLSLWTGPNKRLPRDVGINIL